MSWTHEGNRGTANSKVASTTLTVTLNADVDVGQILILWVACDTTSAGPDGSAGTVDVSAFAVWDDADNLYAQIYAAGGAAANDVSAGNTVFGALFVCRVQYALTNGDLITIEINEAPVAKAASVHEFTIDRDTWARGLNAIDYEPHWQTANGDVPGLTVSTSFTTEYLALHLLAVEGPNTDTYTFPGGWTQITGDGTTGGADDSNAHIRGSFKVFTGSSETIDVSSDTADRDLSTCLIFLTECDFRPLGGPGEFPVCEVLDDFNRANVNPLTGGLWEYSATGGGLGGRGDGSIVNAHFAIDGNEVKLGDTGHIDNYGKYYWDDALPCYDFEVWATMSQVPTDSSDAQVIPQPYTNQGTRGVHVGLSGPDGAAVSGPSVGFFRRVAGNNPAPPVLRDHLWFRNPAQGVVTMVFAGDHASGMRIGLQGDGGRYLHAWVDRDTGHGWELWSSEDNLGYLTPGTFTYGVPTRFTMWISGTETKADDFGGCYECFGPQIYRRVFD